MAYFDNNATTPLNPAAREMLARAAQEFWYNPSSPYRHAARVHNALEEARATLATRLSKPANEVLFTAGATEANNAIIRYLAEQLPEDSLLALSPFEHPSVLEASQRWLPGRTLLLKAGSDGSMDPGQLDSLFATRNLAAVSLMAVSNETGVIQPWQEVAERCNKAGILFLCDASQWFGKRRGGEFQHCDFLVGCGHKFGGPKGTGFVALSANTHGFLGQVGGGQESGRRAGTENVPSILSMLAALEYSESRMSRMESQGVYRDHFEDQLVGQLPGIECIGKSATRVPNTSFLILPKYENLRWVTKLDRQGFQVSTGSACSTGKTNVSPALEALGFPPDRGRRTMRVSSGPDNTESEWEALGSTMLTIWEALGTSEDSSGTEVISI